MYLHAENSSKYLIDQRQEFGESAAKINPCLSPITIHGCPSCEVIFSLAGSSKGWNGEDNILSTTMSLYGTELIDGRLHRLAKNLPQTPTIALQKTLANEHNLLA